MTRLTRHLSAELALIYVDARLSPGARRGIGCPDRGAMFILCLFVAAWHRWERTAHYRSACS